MDMHNTAAVVMAGGRGRRLSPLTDEMPKPLVDIAGKPAAARILRHLKKSGFSAAALTLGYKGELLRRTLGENCEGISLTYIDEETPRGTAGGVAGAKKFINGFSDSDFFVISGDAVTNCDIAAAFARHKSENAAVTLILHKVDNPLEYGIIIGDFSHGYGRIDGFIEKPPFSLAYSNLVNTGIYVVSKRVLDLIPTDREFDFARDLFPLLLARGELLLGAVDNGYWCDIGTPESYLSCCLDIWRGRVRGVSPEPRTNVDIAGSAVLIDSVVCGGVTVGANSEISGTVLCENVTVGENSTVADSVVGAHSRIGHDTDISGITLPPRSVVADGSEIGKERSAAKITRTGNGIFDITGGVNFAAAAIGRLFSPCIVLGGGEPPVRVAYSASAAGGNAFYGGDGNEALARFAAVRQKSACALVTSGSDFEVTLTLFDKNGMPPPHDRQRKFLILCEDAEGEKFAPRLSSAEITKCDSPAGAYVDSLRASAGDELKGVRIFFGGGTAAEYAERAAVALGAEPVGAEGFADYALEFDGAGRLISLSERAEDSFFSADIYHLRAILFSTMPRGGGVIALPADAPVIFDSIIASRGYTAKRISSLPADGGENELRAESTRELWQYDDAAAALKLLAYLKGGRTLSGELSRLPEFYVCECDLVCDGDPCTVVRGMLSGNARIPDSGDGLLYLHEGNTARIFVGDRGKIRIIAAAAATEAARELTDFAAKDIRANAARMPNAADKR